MNKLKIILLVSCFLGCAEDIVVYRIKATGERVVYNRVSNNALGTVLVDYLDEENRTYSKIVKKEDIVLEKEYLQLR